MIASIRDLIFSLHATSEVGRRGLPSRETRHASSRYRPRATVSVAPEPRAYASYPHVDAAIKGLFQRLPLTQAATRVIRASRITDCVIAAM
jgi:hypothetical protein